MKKIVIDWNLCEANAVCVRWAPEVFKVDDKDFLHVLQEYPPEELMEKVSTAVKRCPKRAISVVDE